MGMLEEIFEEGNEFTSLLLHQYSSQFSGFFLNVKIASFSAALQHASPLSLARKRYCGKMSHTVEKLVKKRGK